MARRSKALTFENKPRFAVIVDGGCESWYFQMLKRNERTIGVHLVPEIPQKKTLKEQYNRVIELSAHYDNVFWIVDYDVIARETLATKKGAETAAQIFKKYCKALEQLPNVTVIVNNPCLEFWLLLHFESTGKYFNECEGATKQLKKHLPDYEKTLRYYTKQGNDIYLKLRGRLQNAILNAQKLGCFDCDNPKKGMSEMHLLFNCAELKQIST